MSSIIASISSGIREYFKEMFQTPDLTGLRRGRLFDAYGQPLYRLSRYAFYWSCFDNTVYDSVHKWSARYKTDYALYRNTRGCYNPFFRLGEFWATHTWQGHIDASKQDGRIEPSGIPIVTTNDAIRDPINKLWRDSNWESNKEIVARLGAVKGDVAIRVEDDPVEGRVRILPVDASTLVWVRTDPQGNVDGYQIQENRFNPEVDLASETAFGLNVQWNYVLYTERMIRQGNGVLVQTYKDGVPYAWNGESAEYTLPYPFVPLVLINHMKVIPDYTWGWSEFQGILTKAREADHVASNLHSQIRKASDPRFFVAGAQPPRSEPAVAGNAPGRDNPYPADSELPFMYGGLGSTITDMLFPLDIQFTSMEIQNQVNSMEKDYPELRYDSARVSGDASAKALREVRKTAEAKVHARRVGYDNALVRAQMMALTVGGVRGYPGYEGIGLESYQGGDLDHTIGERTVFLMDPLDRIEEETAFWQGAVVAKNAGVPLVIYLKRAGWTDVEIQAYQDALADQQQQAVDQAQALTDAQPPAPPTNPPPPGNGQPATSAA